MRNQSNVLLDVDKALEASDEAIDALAEAKSKGKAFENRKISEFSVKSPERNHCFDGEKWSL